MADTGILITSSLLNSSNPPPFPLPLPLPLRPNPNPKPLLSNVRRDLTIFPSHPFPSSPSPSPSPSPSTHRLLKYYARLASKLAADGRLSDFLMLAETVLTSDAVVVAESPPQFVSRISTGLVAAGVCKVLRRRERSLGEVLDFLQGANELGIGAESLLDEAAVEAVGRECRRVLVEGRRLEEFVVLMETLVGYGFPIKNIADPVDILKLFVEKSDPDMALRYASIFPHSQLLFCSIIEEFGKKRNINSAMRAYEASKEKSGGFNMFACRSIIDVCGLCGDYLKSRSIFKELLAQKITLNIYVFNSLMNVNSHDLNYTLHVYKRMQTLGVTPDMTSYNVLLKACCNAKRVDLAQDIYKEIKHKASEGALQLDVITYSTMIKVFADAKMWQMAFSIKEEMLLAEVSPNIVTWSSLISACTNAGLLDRAIQIFEQMLMAGCEPNAQCCNILLYACVKSCQYDRAFRIFYTWKETGFKIFHTTKGFFTMVPFRPTVATFNILMKACGTDYYRAKALMEEMESMGVSPNHISWSVLVDIYGIAQNTMGAMEAFRTMRGVGIKLDVVAYTTAIKACVENKKLKMAFSLFEEMKRCRIQPNLVTYNTLLRARRRYGSLHEVQQCLTIYQEMRKSGYSPNDYYLKELLEEWCEGVISNQDRALTHILKKHKMPNSHKHHGLLLEKVAAHLQTDVGDNQAIDIRGLTKVEARIVILSVLWKIRESYRSAGKLVQDDMIIISGAQKEKVGPNNYELEVQLAIIHVLQKELGLEVITGYGSAYENHANNLAAFQKIEPLNDYKHVARRPQDLGVLKVSRRSLCNWLHKREG